MSNPESLLSLVSLLNYLEITDAHVCTKFGVSCGMKIYSI